MGAVITALINYMEADEVGSDTFIYLQLVDSRMRTTKEGLMKDPGG